LLYSVDVSNTELWFVSCLTVFLVKLGKWKITVCNRNTKLISGYWRLWFCDSWFRATMSFGFTRVVSSNWRHLSLACQNRFLHRNIRYVKSKIFRSTRNYWQLL